MTSEVQEIARPLPRNAKSEYDEFLLLFERCLPPALAVLWFTSPKGIDTLARKGGLTNLPDGFVSKALKSNQNNSRGWDKNNYKKKWNFCFPGERAARFAAPKYQDAFLKTASEEEKEELSLPDGYFLEFGLNFLKKYTSSAEEETGEPQEDDESSDNAGEEEESQEEEVAGGSGLSSSSTVAPEGATELAVESSVPPQTATHCQSPLAQQTTTSNPTEQATATTNSGRCEFAL